MKKSKFFLFGFLLTGWLLCHNGFLFSENKGIEYIGSTLWTKAFDVEIKGRYAFCAFINGMVILDISDKKNPDFVSQLYLGGGASLAVSENHVYIAAGKKGLKTVDAADPRQPKLLGSLTAPGESRDIVVSGKYVFLASGEAGIIVADVENPSSPKIIASLDTPGYAESAVLNNNLLFVADGDVGIHIINGENPESPVMVSSFDTDGKAERIALCGEYAFVADGYPGIQILGIKNPAHPVLLKTFSTAGYAHSIDIKGDYACVGNLYDGGFQIFNISDPTNPLETAWHKYTMYNEGWEVKIDGEFAYIVDYFAGVHILSILNKQKPRTTGIYRTPGSVIAASVWNDHIFAACDLSGLRSIDFTHPKNPIPSGSAGFFRGVHGITVSENIVSYTDRWTLRTFDVSDPKKMKLLHSLQTPGVARTVVVQENYAYLTADNSGFHVIDLTDPASTKIVGSLEMPGFAYGLCVSENKAYIANADTGFHIIDITEKRQPKELGSLRTPGLATGVTVKGDLAFIADGPEGLHIVDVSHPNTPTIISTCMLPNGYATGAAVKENFVYVSDEIKGLIKIDITDPKKPKIIDSFETPGESTGLVLSGDYILVFDSFSLLILK
ncbi:MAG: hypothetical protein JXB26_00560 [Candidatus Aminicenantes bacterium]|nr:hypothetical protein [Candidatus Aminicenantes bacterium]